MLRRSLLAWLLVCSFTTASAALADCHLLTLTGTDYIYDDCGRILVGPYPQLTVTDPTTGHSVLALIQRPNAGPNAALIFRTKTADVVTGVNSQWAIGKSGASGQETLYFALNASGDEFGAPKVAFWNDGTVGIGTGTTAPTATLDVNGGIHANGPITGTSMSATYQDVAEWVPSNGDLEPGTVVVLDPAHDNRVMPSARAYDTAVAGVVSARPGMILGEAGADKEQIATTGRVKVRVDASHAPVAIGDLLVTGDRPGTAIRSEPIEVAGTRLHRPGTVLGKALQALPSGEGEILVLLSLQ